MESSANNIDPIIEYDLPLQTVIKEELDDSGELLPGVIHAGDHPQPEVILEEVLLPNLPNATSEVIESPTTGDSSTSNPVSAWNSKCAFCSRIPTIADEPKLLECLHSACAPCIAKSTEQNQVNVESSPEVIVCQLCSLSCSVNQIIDNQFILDLSNPEETSDNQDKNIEIKCSSCSDEAIATSWCVDCSEYICDNCVQAHQRLKITKDHTIKPKDDGGQDSATAATSSVPKSAMCSVHPQERLSLFCVVCDKLNCRDCQLTEHREHKYKFINEIAEETRSSMALLLKDVSYKRVLLSSAMTVIDDRQKLIQEKKASLVREITQMVVKLTNTINFRGKQLVMRLNEVCDSKQKTLNEKKEALDQLSMLTDHCVSFTQHVLDRASDMALLHSKKHVLSHLNRIKCRRADIPNPEIPVRIHLALEKVPDLIKVVSSIGAIVVDGKIYPSGTNVNSNGTNSNGSVPHQSPSPQSMPAVSPQSGLGMGPVNMPQQPLSNNSMYNVPQVFGNQRPSLKIPQNQRQLPPILPRPYNGQQPPPPHPMQRLPIGTNNQQVTSSTHPHGLGGPQNLRGLLQTTPSGYNLGANSPSQGAPPPPPANYQPPNNQGAMYRMRLMQSQQQNLPPQYCQPPSPAGFGNFSQPQQRSMKFTSPQQMQKYFQQLQQQQQQQQQQQRQYPPQMNMVQNPLMNYPPTVGRQGPQSQRNDISPPQMGSQYPGQQYPQSRQRQTPPGGLSAQWHIPQQNYTNTNGDHYQSKPNQKIDDSFKITLKNLVKVKPDGSSQNKSTPTVTSTIPKTPSPNTIQNKSDDTERKLDKFCEDSVNDLMATIAKLDSNGVQVLPEGRTKGTSPNAADSSTDNRNSNNEIEDRNGNTGKGLNVPSTLIKNPMNENEKDDPNEDWCAVCMDGGELVCCDKCPKVFHQLCHIPNLSVEESDTWQCLLCMNFADIPSTALGEKREPGLSPREKKISERIVLELYCQYEPSLYFREVVPPDHIDYHSKIKKPIALDMIRKKLDWSSPDHYTEIAQLISDLRLMFRNAYSYNEKNSVVYDNAVKLEEFLDQQLEKWLPSYAYEDPLREDDSDLVQPPLKRYRRILSE